MADCSLKRFAIDDDFLQQLRGVFKGAGGLSFWRGGEDALSSRRGMSESFGRPSFAVAGWTRGRQEQKKDDQALDGGLREAGLKM